ncbi:hypothetical protein PENSUB_7246 [Penicillium subrubescens]|uniref:Uncharacterized protein n=1 Tax=Penicillium subrubescens TaxID=1316194 RepID=A0A1Q5TNA5_9EURO|nr:hypothetical protein PENSUB_7246 [Penicillium subrubescens]
MRELGQLIDDTNKPGVIECTKPHILEVKYDQYAYKRNQARALRAEINGCALAHPAGWDNGRRLDEVASSVDLGSAVSHRRSDKDRNDVQVISQPSFVDPNGPENKDSDENPKYLLHTSATKQAHPNRADIAAQSG